MSRHLIVVLALVAAAGSTLALRPRDGDENPPFRSVDVPALVDGWIAAEGAAEDVLPTDPRALSTVRRTFSRDDHSVLVTVARYRSLNHPEHRPLSHMIVPAGGVGEVAAETLRVDLAAPAGWPGDSAPVNLLSLQWRRRPLAVAYWYQLDAEAITNEYFLRLQLFIDTLRSRSRAVMLVRVAGDQRADVAEFLRTFYPLVRDLPAP